WLELVEGTDSEDKDKRDTARHLIASWMDLVLDHPELLDEVGLERILGWDLQGLHDVDTWLDKVLTRAGAARALARVPTLEPPNWRAKVIHSCCEAFPEARADLVAPILALMHE